MISSNASVRAAVAVDLHHRHEVVAVDGVVDRVVGDVVGHGVPQRWVGCILQSVSITSSRVARDGSSTHHAMTRELWAASACAATPTWNSGGTLSRGDTRAQPFLDPGRERVEHLVGDAGRLVAAAEEHEDQAPILLRERDELGGARADLGARVGAGLERRHAPALAQVARAPSNDLAEERLLVLEVQVERARRDAGGGRDARARDAVQALAREELGAGLGEALARGLPAARRGRRSEVGFSN